MNEDRLHVSSTHGAEETEGTLLGVSTTSFGWVVLAMAAGLAVFVVLAPRSSLRAAVSMAVLPPVLAFVVLRVLQRDRPPGHGPRWMDSRLTGGHARPPRTPSDLGPRLAAGFPEAYVVQGLTLFGGPAGGHAAMGWEVHLPDLQTASATELNRHREAWSSLLRQIGPQEGFQITLGSSACEVERLLEYQKVTEAVSRPAVRRLRNLNFLQQWQRLERGELRRRQVVLFVTRPLAGTAPWSGRTASREYDTRLAEARTAFDQSEQMLQRILEPVGGRVTRLGDAEVVRLWHERLNPSAVERFTVGARLAPDPESTLADQCWHSELRAGNRQGFVLDGYTHLAFSLKRLPSETYPSILRALTQLPFGGVTLVARVRRREREPVLRRAQASVDRLHQQASRRPDERLAVAKSQLDEKIRRLARGEVVPLEFEFTVMIRARTPAEAQDMAAAVKSTVQAMPGASWYEATLAASSRDLFFQTLPGHPGRTPAGFVHYGEDGYVADLLPLASTFSGHPGPTEALFPGAEGNLVNLVTFLGEGPAATPQNLLVLGAPGVGKSVALEKLLLETDPFFGFTAIIDFGLSQSSYPRAHGQEPTILRLDGRHTLNPFDTQGLPRTPFAQSSLIALLQHMVGVPADEEKAKRQAGLLGRELQQLISDHAQDLLARWPAARRLELYRHSAVLRQGRVREQQSLLEAFLAFREWSQEHPEQAQEALHAVSEQAAQEHASRFPSEVEDLVAARLAPEEHLTLASLREKLEMSDEEACRWLAVLLTPWTEDASYGRLFNGVSTFSSASPVLYFELGH
ncbi:MAG: TraC family protein, partial [Verrucomicrobiales bacterium]|nr:TraC family protein [Verrucomicrobiales bacterium]